MIDTLIIGGGFAGVALAARLAGHHSVTLLEAEDTLAYHASGRSAAMFEEGYGAPAVRALNRASRGFLHDAKVLSPRGLLMVGTAENADAFAKDAASYAMTPLTLQQAQDKWPILDAAKITQAAFASDAQDIDTDRLFQTFARTARTAGTRIVTKAAVTALTRTTQGWEVTTAAQTYHASRIVNAAGAWADVIAKLAGIAPIGLTPYRRSMARIPAPAGHDVRHWPMLFGPGETWYAKPDAGALIVSPADEDPTDPHDAYADDLTLAEGIDRYSAHVTAPVTRLLASWAGLRTFAPDRQLVLGPSPQDASFVWCAGQGGYGVQTSPAASQLTADLILGQTPVVAAADVAALCPARFS